ncbi:MAG: DNA gyrase subunit A [bacterium]|nr:DNA gyrase subunit A [bacterium]
MRKEIIQVEIEDEMQRSYLDYAMSVIVGRALPDVRDGLKPVHRRILYAMWELGLTHNRPFKKSAAVVGEVLGKYHPHGDIAVYDAMVRMVQPFSLRCPLIQGQGNFGSVDGDAAAAYRYTEARLSEIAEFMLMDIEKETVPLVPNFDGRLKEPFVLPSKFPNLLVNGSSGIAVGMATNIPPHNLGEVVDALCALIDKPDLDDFSSYIKGPDFPTGGEIIGTREIRKAYLTGRGKLILKAKVHTEETKEGKQVIYVTEIPYQVNKSALIERIANLVRLKKLESISDIRDESDREGIRIVIELKRDAQERVILNRLFKHTPLQITYGIGLLALQDGVPKFLTLKDILKAFLSHRYEIVKKRTEFDLRQAEKRAHILEGFKIALSHIDKVVKIIKTSKNAEKAKERLMNSFKLSDVQSQAILDMKLSRLVGLERDKIEEEYLETIKLRERLKRILATPKGVMRVIRDELIEIKKKFNTPRRTKIIEAEQKELEMRDLIPNEPVLITLTQKGYIKSSKAATYMRQYRGGIGASGITLTPEDEVARIFGTETHSTLVFFTNTGRCYSLKAYEIPECGRGARGKPLVNLLQLREGEGVVGCLPVKEFKGMIVLATKKGMVKKLKVSALEHIRRTGIIIATLRNGDSIISGIHVNPKDYILLITRKGKVIRFKEELLRPLSRVSQGVRGITLRDKNEVIGVKAVPDKKLSLFFITSDGYGKRVLISKFRLTNRRGLGVIGGKGEIVGCEVVDDDSEVIIITQKGQTLRTKVQNVRKMGRAARGVRLISLREGDKVTDLHKL